MSRFRVALAGGPAATSAADDDLAERFKIAIGGPARVSRGGVALFEVPAGSTYGRMSGVRTLAALATRPPPGADADPAGTSELGSPQLFDEALERAFRELRGRHISTVGVPRMIIRDRIGRPGSRAESWETIIARADEAARKTGVQRVLFGGWGVDPRSRAATDAGFRDVWMRQRRTLEGQSRDLADERVRVGGVLAFAAIVQRLARRRTVRLLRLVALATVSDEYQPAVDRPSTGGPRCGGVLFPHRRR